MNLAFMRRWIGLAWLVACVGLVFTSLPARGQSPEQYQEGAQLYAENCAVCHGPNGEGRVGATLAKDWPSIRPELNVRDIITHGISGSPMPAWSQENGGPLTAEQIDSLVVYILSWQTGGAPSITPRPTATAFAVISPVPNVSGDPNLGAALFAQNCQVCHGDRGEGRVGATLAKSWAGIRPDLNVKTTIANGIPGSVMPAWSQAQGGPLSDTEINHLTAFVLSLADSGVIQPQAPPPQAEPFSPSWLAGWGGVLLGLFVFILIVSGALIAQRKG